MTGSRWFFPLVIAVGLLAGPANADISDSIARIKPSIVIVGTFKSTDSPRFRLRGTGFVVADGNLVVTNAHVLPEATENVDNALMVVQVRTTEKELQMRPAVVLEVDRQHDLALLRFQGAAAPALQIRDSDTVREGQSVAFTGFPIGGTLGFSPVTHRGMISAITPAAIPATSARVLSEAAIREARAAAFEVFQLDATAYPGNSGGPLFDPEKGDVLGVVNMVLVRNTPDSTRSQASGISYAIPSKFVSQLIERARGK